MYLIWVLSKWDALCWMMHTFWIVGAAHPWKWRIFHRALDLRLVEGEKALECQRVPHRCW